MKDRLPTRALLTLNGGGAQLLCTYHKPFDRLAEQDLDASAAGRIGLVFVNSLSAPRAGNGGSVVYWADAFAASGYPCFRLDLPALGDSSGVLPQEFLSFVMGGGYAGQIKQTVRELAERFRLPGVIAVGHCAGSVTALHAASEQTFCKGLVMMEPRFDHPKHTPVPQYRLKLSAWARTDGLGKALRTVYHRTRAVSPAARQDALPTNANLALISRWKQAASSGMPILLLESAAADTGPGRFDYTRFAMGLAGHKARVAFKLVKETDHSFANAAGRDMVRKYIQDWLAVHFPLLDVETIPPHRGSAAWARNEERGA